MPISPTTGVALGAIFGFIFVFTCIISVIKAVRDRKKIKQRIAERERLGGGSHVKNGKCISSIEETISPLPSSSKLNKNTKHANGKSTPSSAAKSVSDERLEVHEFKTKTGVDNLTYAHSHSDIKQKNGACDQSTQSKFSVERETLPRIAHARSTRSVSNDVVERRGGSQHNVGHLSYECLAVQKVLRRHSYDMAVCEHSWLPVDPPSFQTSNKIIQTYCYGRPRTNTSGTVGFENRAFNADDYKNT